MSTNINDVKEACAICGQAHTSTACPMPGSDIQPTEADREEALKQLRDAEETRIKVAEVKINSVGLPDHYSDGDLVDDLRETKCGNGMEAPEEYVVNYYEACARVRQYCARIRADAVKAERERLDNKIREALCNSPHIFVTNSGEIIYLDEACKIVRLAILSDGQEARRG